jgi:hypothetical protein
MMSSDCLERLYKKLTGEDVKQRPCSWLDLLNVLGAQGWELVSETSEEYPGGTGKTF